MARGRRRSPRSRGPDSHPGAVTRKHGKGGTVLSPASSNVKPAGKLRPVKFVRAELRAPLQVDHEMRVGLSGSRESRGEENAHVGEWGVSALRSPLAMAGLGLSRIRRRACFTVVESRHQEVTARHTSGGWAVEVRHLVVPRHPSSRLCEETSERNGRRNSRGGTSERRRHAGLGDEPPGRPGRPDRQWRCAVRPGRTSDRPERSP